MKSRSSVAAASLLLLAFDLANCARLRQATRRNAERAGRSTLGRRAGRLRCSAAA